MSVTKAGNKQGYTHVECSKERSVEKGNDADEEEKEIEGGDDIFEGVKQVDLHALIRSSVGIVSVGTCRRR